MIDRRRLLTLGAATALAPAIARAAGIDARVRTGTVQDVEHVVILMQENRSFDHYFGALNGVRGFADRFPIPVGPNRTVWTQMNGERAVQPFALNTAEAFALMRMEGTPHFWPDAQAAWDQGRMGCWPKAKTDRCMAHYGPGDLPFQYALADAFTVCDAYHCSIQTGTNSNRLFLWTGTNDPTGGGGGPAIGNSRAPCPRMADRRTATTGPPTSSGCRPPGSAGGSTRTWPTISATTRWPASRLSATPTPAFRGPTRRCRAGLSTRALITDCP